MKSKISIIGLGYVGLTTAVCMSKLGYLVVGVDINKERIAKIKLGVCPLNIEKMGAYLKKYHFECYLGQHRKAIMDSDISFVCVETPTKKSGQLDLMPLKKVCKTLGLAIKNKNYHIIVIRSTIFPGSFEILKKVLEKSSGKKCGKDFDLAINPEFLREKHAIEDFFDPSFIVVGAEKKEISKKVMSLYNKIDVKKFVVNEGTGQMIKYLNNSWHACKVSFTNEIAAICEKLGIDSNKLMNLFCEDTKLNISPYYHKPGKAYGSSCLPKDLSVLQSKSKQLRVKCPVINSISESNKIQEKRDKR